MTRLHVVSLPHTATTREFEWCAYTSKCRKFADMMTDRGHDIVLYAAEENDAACSELVPCVEYPTGEIPLFDAINPSFAAFNRRVIDALHDRLEPHDLICLIGGSTQQPIAEAFPSHQVVEFGIGYGGIIPTTHHVYESYAWMHTVLGAQTGGDAHRADGRFYDAVIPNYFDPDDFPQGASDGGYLLYVGRLVARKGIQVALDAAEATGLPLHVAGSGRFRLPDWVEYHGVIGPQERAALMGGAVALLAPTTYVEPFGGVAVEAQMCGTPAITTDWGAFTETVEPEWRGRTLAEFVDAVNRAAGADRQAIRDRAQARYSLKAIAPQYERYFARLKTLWADGWYTLPAAVA